VHVQEQSASHPHPQDAKRRNLPGPMDPDQNYTGTLDEDSFQECEINIGMDDFMQNYAV
jgi:hypothetical protein